jgi:hypothetical protein
VNGCNEPPIVGMNVLHMACWLNRVEIVRVLCEAIPQAERRRWWDSPTHNTTLTWCETETLPTHGRAGNSSTHPSSKIDP